MEVILIILLWKVDLPLWLQILCTVVLSMNVLYDVLED